MRLQFEHVYDLLHEIRKTQGFDVQLHFASFNSRDVQRAFDEGQQVIAAPADHADCLSPIGRNGLVAIENLGIAEYAVQRGAQFMADRHDVAALGLVCVIGGQLRLLQKLIRAMVGVDLLQQELRLMVGFFLGHPPAFVGEHHPPGDDAGYQEQARREPEKDILQMMQQNSIAFIQGQTFLVVNQADQ